YLTSQRRLMWIFQECDLGLLAASMESGRAPGVDGLPFDFYKAFWLELGEDLLE
ncbi:hypothetical protein M9458_056472, partial [Cirrhinus mrigala]